MYLVGGEGVSAYPICDFLLFDSFGDNLVDGGNGLSDEIFSMELDEGISFCGEGLVVFFGFVSDDSVLRGHLTIYLI